VIIARCCADGELSCPQVSLEILQVACLVAAVCGSAAESVYPVLIQRLRSLTWQVRRIHPLRFNSHVTR